MEKQEHLKYPIGKFEYGQTYSLHETRKNIKVIASLPKELKKIIKKASRTQLSKPYRNGGWTVRQVIHHICDSHINAYIRMKMAATEDNPTIKPYDERAWAELESGKDASVKLSLALLKSLHKKWVDFMEALSDDDLKKGYYHPAAKRTVLLPEAIALYAWHSEHHLAHIRLVTDSKSHTELSVKLHSMPSTETPEEAAPKQPEKRRARPAKTLKPHEALARARAARAAKPKTDPDKPKMSRQEVLARARAARAAKQPAKPEPDPATTTPAAPQKTGRPAKPKTDPDKPKMTRQEVLALARAARAAKHPAKPKPDPDKPKMSRQEVLALARAARAAKKPKQATPDQPAAPKPVKTHSKKAVATTPAEAPTQTPPVAPSRQGRKKIEPDTAPPAPDAPASSATTKKARRPPKEKKA